MRIARSAATILLLLGVSAPIVDAQAIAAEGCVRMCDPKDATVNPDPNPYGPVWLFFYAPEPTAADLVLVPLTTRVSATLGSSANTPTFLCHVLRWSVGDLVNLTAINDDYEGSAWAPTGPARVSDLALVFLYVRIPQFAPAPIPIRVNASVREGMYGDGAELAAGFLEAQLDGERLWELRVPLTGIRDRWHFDGHGSAGFATEIRFCVQAAALTPNLPVEFVTGPQTPARLLLSVSRPLENKKLEIIRGDEWIRVRFEVLPTFGQYDVDAENATLELVGRHPRGPWTPELVRVAREFEHDAYDAPVTFEWRVNRTELFNNTDYTFRASAPNLQGTFTASTERTFRTLTFEGASQVPGLDLVPVLVALVVAAATRGFRTRPRR
jgi:hypothetical protein